MLTDYRAHRLPQAPAPKSQTPTLVAGAPRRFGLPRGNRGPTRTLAQTRFLDTSWSRSAYPVISTARTLQTPCDPAASGGYLLRHADERLRGCSGGNRVACLRLRKFRG